MSIDERPRLTRLPRRITRVTAPEVASWPAVREHVLAIDGPATCAMVGVIGLEAVNVAFGRSVGDAVIAEVHERLRRVAGPTGWSCRIGGDRFLVALPRWTWNDGTTDALLRAVTAPAMTDVGAVVVSAAIGLATLPSSDTEALTDRADAALRRALRAGPGAVEWCYEETSDEERRLARIATALPHAIRAGEITAHYQPIVDLVTGRVVQLEVLARWHSPQLGNVPPPDLIRAAEQTGLIHDVGRIVAGAALDLLAVARRDPRWADVGISLNASGRELQHVRYVEHVLAALAARHLPGSALQIEITETESIGDVATVASRLEELRTHGVRVAIDDFGTGLANLSYLRALPIDSIKLDRRFVNGLVDDPADRSVVRHLVAMANELDITVIGEGVEHVEQHRALERLGCRYAQGYLYARPRPPERALDAVTIPRRTVPSAGAPRPVDDAERVRVLRATEVLDTARDAVFDELVAEAAALCAAPVALVSLVDAERQWIKASVGTDLVETDRDVAFCAHAICQDDLFEVPDATADPRFADNPLVTGGPNLRFYAGVPLTTDDGHNLGALCVIDTVPRRLDALQRTGLVRLARLAAAQLDLRRSVADVTRAHAEPATWRTATRHAS